MAVTPKRRYTARDGVDAEDDEVGGDAEGGRLQRQGHRRHAARHVPPQDADEAGREEGLHQ